MNITNCSACDRSRPDGVPLTPCPCNQVAYCSRQCQDEHTAHESVCPVRRLVPSLQGKSPEVVAQILSTISPTPSGQFVPEKDKKTMQQTAARPGGASPAGSGKLSSQSNALLQNASKEQLMSVVADICANCNNGIEALENIVRRLKMNTGGINQLGGQVSLENANELQMAGGNWRPGQKGAWPGADVHKSPTKDMGDIMKMGEGKGSELPAFFSGVIPGMPGGGSLGDSLEPAGNSTLGDSLETKPGEKGAGPAVKNFIEKLQTASMGLDTVKDWGEDDLNEFAQMFLIDRDQTIEIWHWIQANKK